MKDNYLALLSRMGFSVVAVSRRITEAPKTVPRNQGILE